MCLASLYSAGCAPAPLPPVQLNTAGVTPSVNYDNLNEVLTWLIDKQGLVEPLRIEDVEKQLHSQLQLFAVTGPDVTPKLFGTKADRLAYWYNARAAWSIRLAMDLFNAKQLKACGLDTRSFPLDGQAMTLKMIDAKLDSLAGFQGVVASPSMKQDRAIMPQNAFDPKTVEQKIPERFNQYICDRTRFIIDIAKRQIQFPPAFWQYREKIIADNIKQYGTPQPTFATALLPMLNRPAVYRLQNAVGYKCVESPQPCTITVKNDE